MAKPNYQFEKRQRDLAKKRKQEEKRLRKRAARESGADTTGETSVGVPGSDTSDSADTGPGSPAGT